MRTKRYFLNTFVAFLLQLVTMISGFILPKVMLVNYGSEINGLTSSINQFITYFNLAQAGIAGASLYAFYKPIADNDQESANGVMSATDKYYKRSGIWFTVFILVFAIVYPFIVKINLAYYEVFFLVLVLSFSSILTYLIIGKYRAFLSANQQAYILSLASLITVILNTTIISILAYFQLNVVFVRLAGGFASLISVVFVYFYVKTRYKWLNAKSKPNYESLSRRGYVMYLEILGAIQGGWPVIVATLIFAKDLSQVSILAVYSMVLGGIAGIFSIFTTGTQAAFGDLIIRKDTNKLQETYKEFETAFYWLMTWVYACTLILIMTFIQLYTKSLEDAAIYIRPWLGVLLVINGIFNHLKTPQGMLITAAGMYKETRYRVTIQAAIGLVFSTLFGYLFHWWFSLGLEGIITGMILGHLYRTIDLLFYTPKHITGLKWQYSLRRILRVILTVTICYIPFFFIEYQPPSFLWWIVLAVIVAIYVFVVTLVMHLIFDRKIVKKLFKRITLLFKKKSRQS